MKIISRKMVISGMIGAMIIGAIVFSVFLYAAAKRSLSISDAYAVERALLLQVIRDFDHLQDGELPVEKYLAGLDESYEKIRTNDYIFYMRKKDRVLTCLVIRKADNRKIIDESFEICAAEKQEPSPVVEGGDKIFPC